MTERFQVSTRRTGLLRIVRVEVLEPGEFRAAYFREWARRNASTSHLDGYDVLATVLPRLDWEDRDPRPYQARMLFRADHLTATVIAHEATHAALHLYSIDSYRDHARASAHLHVGNEVVPYLVGDIFAGIAQRMSTADGRLQVGFGRDYQDDPGRV